MDHEQHAESIGDIDDELSAVSRRRKRAAADMEMDITPMIDITFLLLIFFIVTSKMTQAAGPPLPQARYGEAVPTKASVVITLTAAEGGAAAVYLGDGMEEADRVKAADLNSQAEQIAAYVETALKGPPRKEFVLLKAERIVKHREVARVSRAVGRVGSVDRVYVAVLEVD